MKSQFTNVLPYSLRDKTVLILTVCLTAIATVNVVAVGGTGYTMDRRTMDAGGSTTPSIGGGFELTGTIGQPDAGLHTGDGFALTGGFWFQLESGDCNQDGAVTHYDVAEFGGCLTGPDVTVSDAQCGCADFDSDDDVDLRDVSSFQRSASAW